MPIFTAVTQNHGNGQKSQYTVKITVITAIVNSWFSYSPSSNPWINFVTLLQTDGQTTCDRKTALCTIVHRAVKMVSAHLWSQHDSKERYKPDCLHIYNTQQVRYRTAASGTVIGRLHGAIINLESAW